MPSDLPSHAGVLVVGGGVVGAATALSLAEDGRDVTLLERRGELGTLTTSKAFAGIRTQFGTKTLVEMAAFGLAFYAAAPTTLGCDLDQIGFQQHGYLWVTDNPEYVRRLSDALDGYEALGVQSSELLKGDELRARFPFIGDDVVAGVFHADGAWVDPDAVVDCLVDAAQRVGRTQVITGVEVRGVRQAASGRVVGLDTDRGEIAAEDVVVCGGPFANEILSAVGVELPITLKSRYRGFIGCSNADVAKAPFTINVANGAYWRPVSGGVWISHANIDGQAQPALAHVPVPPDFVASTIAQLQPVAPFLAGLDATAARTTGGQPCYTPDDIPFVGSVPSVRGLWVNCGHWAGVMLAPASARLLTELMAGSLDESENPCRLSRLDEGELVAAASTNKFGGWG